MLSAGTRLGSYEILSSLGAGGMGEVYKARDTRLDRTVAVKVLPLDLASDPQFRERFQREARTISQLDHPNVCTLYDVGEDAGTSFLVMQYLEGETLEARLKNGPIAIEPALRIAIQIADALSAAHRSGIVHRDLKPGNVMLMRPSSGSADGSHAKLLDFGLAKTAAPVMTTGGLSVLPTTPVNVTAQGAILGTFQYMAPEQLEGENADARSDIFAFGALVYEMVTGRRAFEERSHARLIGAILKDQPPALSTIEPRAPQALERVVATCLAKDPDERWQSARDLLRELKWIAAAPQHQLPKPDVGSTRSQTRWLWPVAAATFALSTLALGLWVLFTRGANDSAPAIRFSIQAPTGTLRFSGSPAGGNTPPMAVSPDGRWIVFSVLAEGAGRAQLWVRGLDGLLPRLLPGAENARYPFWSADSRTVAYFTQSALMKVDVAGGRAQKIADTDNPTGGTWNRDGTILFSLYGKGLFRLPATGGDPVAVPLSSDGKSVGRFPVFLPDGRHFLFLNQSGPIQDDAVFVGSLDSPERTRLLATNNQAWFASGRLLFVSGETLMSQPFDPETLRLSGAAVPVAEPVTTATTGYAGFSVSENGVLVTAVGGQNRRELKWFDRSGKPLGEVKAAGRYFASVDLLPDGRILAGRVELSGEDIRLLDPARGTETLLISGGQAVLSPDRQTIAFSPGGQDRTPGIRRIGLAGASAADTLLSGRVAWPTDWSADGRWILFMHPAGITQGDVSMLDVTGGGTVTPFLQSPAAEGQARFSPDQQWVAYQSDESGAFEVYVRHFPDGGQKAMVSSGGGLVPRWDHSGRSLYYLAADGTLTEVAARADGARLVFGKPQPLFRVDATVQYSMGQVPYAISADRSHFLISELVGENLGPRLDVIVNWPATLKP